MKNRIYKKWFILPLLVIFTIFFITPTIITFFFSLTIWSLTEFRFVGLYNFKTFFSVFF